MIKQELPPRYHLRIVVMGERGTYRAESLHQGGPIPDPPPEVTLVEGHGFGVYLSERGFGHVTTNPKLMGNRLMSMN